MPAVLVCLDSQSAVTSCIVNFKKPEQNLIDLPAPKTSTEPKRDVFEML